MADTDIIVSEMTPASQINTTDLMIMTQPDAQAETGYSTKSGTVLQVANKMLKGTEYSTDLPDFTDKTPLGGLEELKADIKALLPVSSASGNPCTFETNLADNLVSLKAAILASGGNGTPSTPIPIVGHSELNLVRCGVNLYDEEWESGAFDGSTGVPVDNPDWSRSKNPILVNGSKSYYCNFNGIDGTHYAYAVFYDINGAYIDKQYLQTKSSITTPANCSYMKLQYKYPIANVGDYDVSINYPSSNTYHEPYNGQTFTVSFGQTVYGGVYDANSGKVKPNVYYPSYNGETINGRWLSSKDVYVEGNTPTTGAQVVCLDEYDTEIDVSELSVDTIVGVNNVFCDTGETELKYLIKG